MRSIDPRHSTSSEEAQMQRRRLLLLTAVSVIAVGVIAGLVIQRPLIQPPPFSFMPTSDDLFHLKIEAKEEMPGMPGSYHFYSFPGDFNSIRLQADTELLSLDYKEFLSEKADQEGWYKRAFDIDSANSGLVQIWNNRKLEKGEDRPRDQVGWVTVQVSDLALTSPLPESLEGKLKEWIDVNRAM